MSFFKSTKQTEYCPQCHSPLQIKQGKSGLFLGCTNYPTCDYLKPLQQTYHIIKTLEYPCPECLAFLQLKQGSFGIFIGCSRYPDCHFTVQEEQRSQEDFNCPECQQHSLVARTGRSGKIFYGCKGYPDCKFTLPSKPLVVECPACHGKLAIEKKRRYKSILVCADKRCQHTFEYQP